MSEVTNSVIDLSSPAGTAEGKLKLLPLQLPGSHCPPVRKKKRSFVNTQGRQIRRFNSRPHGEMRKASRQQKEKRVGIAAGQKRLLFLCVFVDMGASGGVRERKRSSLRCCQDGPRKEMFRPTRGPRNRRRALSPAEREEGESKPVSSGEYQRNPSVICLF